MANLKNKICIVGAGPSGLSTALFLQEKGYKDITILEKDSRLGGKCFSPMFRGKHFEMGAGIAEPNGVTQELINLSGAEPDGESPHVMDKDARTGKGTSPFPFLKKEEMVEFDKQMKKMKQLLETKYKGYNKPGHIDNHADLRETFEDFCKMNEVPLCMHAWLKPYTSFGYGYFNLVPAAYVLKYMDWNNMVYLAKGEYLAWVDGTQSVWEKVAMKLNRYPRFSTEIKNISRKNNKVYVKTETGVEEFDTIIFTSPLQHLKDFVDLSEEEVTLFSKIVVQDYKTFAFTVENKPEHSAFLNGNIDISKVGHPMLYYNRWEKDEDQIITAYIMGNEGENLGDEECLQILKEDMQNQGITVKDLVMHNTWEYFPHVNSYEMKHGWYEKVETLQGKNNTYYAGEVMNFANIEQCAAYSKQLVNKYFNL